MNNWTKEILQRLILLIHSLDNICVTVPMLPVQVLGRLCNVTKLLDQ